MPPAVPMRMNPGAIDHEVRTLQQALRIVLGAYGGAPSGDAKERMPATEWLRSFRSRDDAWDACIAVLGAQRGGEQNQVTLNEQVFASQALLFKCRRRRAAITHEDVACLLRLALAFTGPGLRPVLTQLCLGICACAVRHTGWEASKVLPDLVLYCQQASADAGPNDFGPRLLMLELLTVLPDEASSKSGLSTHPDRRAEFLWSLRNGAGEGKDGGGRLALAVLSQLLEPGALPTEGGRAAILRCALAWIQLEAVEWSDLFTSPVMAFALESLDSPEACDEACELLTVSLEAFSDPGAVHSMFPRVLEKRHGLANPSSEDVCRCLATVLSTAACCYLPCILRPELAGLWGSLLQVMVAMLEHPSLEIAALALDFWGRLGELLTETAGGDTSTAAGATAGLQSMGEMTGMGGASPGVASQGPRSPALEECVRRACFVALMRACLPSAEQGGIGAMDDDARDELEDFREEVEDLLKTLILPASPAPNPTQSPLRGESTIATADRGEPGKHQRRNSSSGGIDGIGGSNHHRGRGGSLGSTGAVALNLVGSPPSALGAALSGGGNSNGVAAVLTPVVARTNGVGFHENNDGTVDGFGSPIPCRRSHLSPGNGAASSSSFSSPVTPSPSASAPSGARTGVAGAPPPRVPTLSPVQMDLLAWLENLAATTTLEALKHQHAAASVSSGGGGPQVAAGGSSGVTTPFVNSNMYSSIGGHHPAPAPALAPFTTVVEKQLGNNEAFAGSGSLSAAGLQNGNGSDVASAGEGAGSDWTKVEVLLRVLSAVSKAFVIRDNSSGIGGGAGGEESSGGNSALEAIVHALPALPSRARELQISVAVLVGGLAPWLARRPGCLEPALNAALGALELDEEAASKAEVSMREKGGNHVGAVSLSKLASAAGASLVAVPALPTHLLQRYLQLSQSLQQHRLQLEYPPAVASQSMQGSGGGTVGIAGAAGAGGSRAAYHHHSATAGINGGHSRRVSGDGSCDPVGARWTDSTDNSFGGGGNSPPLHASSLTLFLGCLVKMLGEEHPQASGGPQETGGSGVGAGVGGGGGGEHGVKGTTMATGGIVLENPRNMQNGSGVGAEVGEVLRRLVEGEARSLGGVLDRRRELASIAAIAPAAHDALQNQNRVLGEIASDALSNMSLILRKSSPALGAPNLVAGFCGAAGPGAPGAGGRGLLVEMVGACGEEEERLLSGLCQVFEALTWSIAQRLRHAEGSRSGLPMASDIHHGGYHPPLVTPTPNGHVDSSGDAAGRIFRGNDNAEGLKLAVDLGDALAEAFLRRPSVRFLETLRCVTKELATFSRHSAEASGDPNRSGETAVVPDLSLRACDWANQGLYAAASGAAAAAAAANAAAAAVSPGATPKSDVVVVVAGGGSGGWGAAGARGGGGPDAQPEMVEAMFKVMTEWVNELPVPSLRWLEAWLGVAVSAMAVRHRGPARAVLNLIQACCSQRADPTFTSAFSVLLREKGLGVGITRGLLSGLCGAMPSWMLDDLVATMRALFDAFNPASVSVWVETVLRDPTFERYGVSDQAKVAFARKLKEDLCCKDWRAFKAGLKAFCGGKKKGTGGTPPVHAAYADRKLQQQQQQQGLLQLQTQEQAAGSNPAGGQRHSGDFRVAGGVATVGGVAPDTSPSMLRSMTM